MLSRAGYIQQRARRSGRWREREAREREGECKSANQSQRESESQSDGESQSESQSESESARERERASARGGEGLGSMSGSRRRRETGESKQEGRQFDRDTQRHGQSVVMFVTRLDEAKQSENQPQVGFTGDLVKPAFM